VATFRDHAKIASTRFPRLRFMPGFENRSRCSRVTQVFDRAWQKNGQIARHRCTGRDDERLLGDTAESIGLRLCRFATFSNDSSNPSEFRVHARMFQTASWLARGLHQRDPARVGLIGCQSPHRTDVSMMRRIRCRHRHVHRGPVCEFVKTPRRLCVDFPATSLRRHPLRLHCERVFPGAFAAPTSPGQSEQR